MENSVAAQGDAAATAPLATQLVTRYQDAYALAQLLIRWGNRTGVVGIWAGIVAVFGIVIQLMLAGSRFELTTLSLTIFVLGMMGMPILFLLGRLIAAQGHRLCVAVDLAVHSSPVLNETQRVRILSLQ